MINFKKIGLIGCGNVGSTIAYTLMQSGLINELVLIDSNTERAKGEAMDIAHSSALASSASVYAGSYNDIKDAGIVIIAAGHNQRPGDTRLSLLDANSEIMSQITPMLTPSFFNGIILVVTNPVDILTYIVQEQTRQPHHRVIGSGTVLDTARLKYEISELINIDPRNIHAYVIGEHGDSEFAAFGSANVSGMPISYFCPEYSNLALNHELHILAKKVKESAAEIISKKGATFYGIGMAVKRIVEAILKDERSILPLSVRMTGDYGIKDVCLSIPCVLGKNGISQKLDYPLTSSEEKKLKESAKVIKNEMLELF